MSIPNLHSCGTVPPQLIDSGRLKLILGFRARRVPGAQKQHIEWLRFGGICHDHLPLTTVFGVIGL
jgi:hypothetical protein